jgi:hypothetical protein
VLTVNDAKPSVSMLFHEVMRASTQPRRGGDGAHIHLHFRACAAVIGSTYRAHRPVGASYRRGERTSYYVVRRWERSRRAGEVVEGCSGRTNSPDSWRS